MDTKHPASNLHDGFRDSLQSEWCLTGIWAPRPYTHTHTQQRDSLSWNQAEMPNCLSDPSTSRGVASFGKQGGGTFNHITLCLRINYPFINF